eukprot:468373-Rhodomonas_salina.1
MHFSRRCGSVQAVVCLMTLLVGIAADYDDDPNELDIQGRSLGIPACRGAVGEFACHRTDRPLPPDVCVQRDPDDERRCLQTRPAFSYQQTGLPPLPIARRLDASSVRSCDGSDP